MGGPASDQIPKLLGWYSIYKKKKKAFIRQIPSTHLWLFAVLRMQIGVEISANNTTLICFPSKRPLQMQDKITFSGTCLALCFP